MHCDSCGFSCEKRGDWNRHIKTKKHLNSNTELRRLLVETQERLRDQQKQINELIPTQFNLTIFLEGPCKDAMDWEEFISTLELWNPNIIPMIIDRIRELGVYRRPIHCVDWNLQKVCIKQKNKWEMDSIKARGIIMDTTTTLKQNYMKQWEEEHPVWYENAGDTDMYTKLITDFEEDAMVITKNAVLPNKSHIAIKN